VKTYDLGKAKLLPLREVVLDEQGARALGDLLKQQGIVFTDVNTGKQLTAYTLDFVFLRVIVRTAGRVVPYNIQSEESCEGASMQCAILREVRDQGGTEEDGEAALKELHRLQKDEVAEQVLLSSIPAGAKAH
jgi:hypothetical protein